MKKTLIALCVIAVISLAVSLPIFSKGLFSMHDDQQVARLYLFDKSLKAGQFPPRWVDDLGFGYGYPLFVFYPPLVYMLGEAFHLIGFGFIESIKIVFFLSILLSGFSMYIFARELWGKFPALISATFYILVPYRALDVYVRGALAESFSFVFLPLILWGFYKLQKEGRETGVYLTAIFLAFLMITHNLIFLPFSMILIIFAAYLISISNNKKNLIYKLSLTGAVAAGLSCFFWLPALIEKNLTIVDELLIVSLANYNIHFVYPQQLWNWQWGFGGSTQGLLDGISFKIGKIHVVVSAISALLSIIIFIKNRRIQIQFVFFVLFLFSAFMTTNFSKPIWDLLEPLAYLQFPWRFLAFTALFASILAGALIYQLRVTFLRLITGAVLLILVFIPNVKLFSPSYIRSDLTDEIATSREVINWDISKSSFEYLPKGVKLTTSNLGTNAVDIQKSQIQQDKLISLKGESYITKIAESPDENIYKVLAKTETKFQFNAYDFPRWIVTQNGREVKTNSDNDLKLINFTLDHGEYNLNIKFRDTSVRYWSNLISAASFLTVIFLITKKWQKKIF